MSKHVHANMIKAKADNMELAVFLNSGPEWVESGLTTMVANDDLDFFLCLPQHKEACLHWLNGGEIEWRDISLGEHYEWHSKENYEDDEISRKYFIGNGFTIDDNEFRIKPRKEKRWIMIHADNSESILKEPPSIMLNTARLIEIEVEL